MSNLGKIRDKFQNCSYSFQVEKAENGQWGFVGNFILNFDGTFGARTTQIPPVDVDLIRKHLSSEKEAVKLGKIVVEECITRLSTG